MKKISVILILALIIALVPMTISAAEEGIKVSVDGTYIEFDQQPILQEDRVLVPVRFIFEALDLQLQWEQETSTIFAFKENTIIVLQIDNPNAFINGEKIELDVPAILMNGRTLVPVRFIAESTGANVEWVPEDSTVVITTE